MPNIIDSLIVTLGLDPSGFKKGQAEVKKGLKETKDSADQTAKEMEAAGKRAASFFGSIRTELLALVGITLSAQGIKTFITGMTSNLQQLAVSSKSLDMSSKSLDGWQRAAEAAGSSAQKITGTLGAFQDTLTKIRTGGAQDDPMFGALASFGAATGANFDYQNDNSEAIMRKIAQNWGKLNKDAQRRFGSMFGFDNATQQAIGNGNLVQDADRFTKMSHATDEATRKAQEFNRRLAEMKQNFSAASQVLYEALIPYVEKLIPLIEKFGNWIATHGPEIQKFFSDSATEVNKVVDAVGGWQNALEILLGFVVGKWALGILGAIGKVAKGFGGLRIPGAGVALGIAGAGAAAYAAEPYVDKALNGMFGDSDYFQRIRTAGNWSDFGNAIIGRGDAHWKNGKWVDNRNAPRGIRNNNPGNLNFAGQAGAEKEGGENGRFAVFGSMQEGIAALYRQLQLYFKRGVNTLSDIVNKYAPAGDNNNVGAYISALSAATGKGANEALDPNDTGTISRLMKGIVDHENGRGYISSSDIMGGIRLGAGVTAMNGSPSPTGAGPQIHIGEVNMTTSATNASALGQDIIRNVQRNRLVTPSLSGQG
jgi:preprotein translocase subunit SecE